MQHLDHRFHFRLPNFCNGGILSDHLSGGGVVYWVPKRDASCLVGLTIAMVRDWGPGFCSTDKTDQSRQLDAMSWSWETSTTANGPAPTCSRGLNIDHRYVQHWRGPATRKSALGRPKPRLGRRIADPPGSRRDRPPVGRDPWCDGKGPANALLGVGDPEAEPGRGRAGSGPVGGAGLSPPGDPGTHWM